MPTQECIPIINRIVDNPNDQISKDELLAWYLSKANLDGVEFIEGLGAFTPLMYAAYLSDHPAGYEILNLFLSDLSIVSLNENEQSYTALDWALANQAPNCHAIAALRRAGGKLFSEIDQKTQIKASDQDDLQISQFAKNQQNTHDPILVESIINSISKLKARYSSLPTFNTVVSEMNLAKAHLPSQEQPLIDEFLNHAFMREKYPLTEYVLSDILCLVWTAISDSKIFILKKMIACHRGEYGVCKEGRFHALVEPLDHLHPDVNLIYGAGAIKASLYQRFIDLLNLSLSKTPNIKQLMLPESEELKTFFEAQKKKLCETLENDYPHAMHEKPDDSPSVKEYLKQLEVDDIPWVVPGLQDLQALHQLHEWISSISDKNNVYITRKQEMLSKQIKIALDPNQAETYLTAFNRIVLDAKALYSSDGWVELITKQKSFDFLPNFKKLIQLLALNIKSKIVLEVMQFKNLDESAFDPCLKLAFKATMPEMQCTEIQVKAFKSALIKSHTINSLTEFAQSKNFLTELDMAEIRYKIDAALLKNRFSETQYDILVCNLQDRSSAEQNILLTRLQALYKLFTLRRDSEEFSTLLNCWIKDIKSGNWFQEDVCFQQFFLEARDGAKNTFFHLLADYTDSTLFEKLVPHPENKELFNKACLDFNNVGVSAIRLFCRNKNTNVCFLLKFCEKEKAVESMLQYHDHVAAFFFLFLNRNPAKAMPKTLDALTDLKEIWPLSDLACAYFFHDLNKDLIIWLLSATQIGVPLFRKLANGGYTVAVSQAMKGDLSKRLHYLEEFQHVSEYDPIIEISYCGFVKTFSMFINSFKTTSEKCQYLKRHDPEGKTALYVAASHNRLNIIESMFSALDDDVAKQELCNIASVKGRTPLMIAAFKGHSAAVFLLLRPFRFSDTATNNNIGLQDKNGQTALHYAITANDSSLSFKTILSHILGNEFKRSALHIQDEEGNTALCTAALDDTLSFTNLNPIKEAFVCDDDLMLYFEKFNKKGHNALHCAAAAGSKNSIRALLSVLKKNTAQLLDYLYCPIEQASGFTALQLAATVENGGGAIQSLLDAVPGQNNKLKYIGFSKLSQTAISLATLTNRAGNLYVLLNSFENDQQRINHLIQKYQFVKHQAPLIYVLESNLWQMLSIILRSFTNDEQRVKYLKYTLQHEPAFSIKTEKCVQTMVSAFENPTLLFDCFNQEQALKNKFEPDAYAAWLGLQPNIEGLEQSTNTSMLRF